MKVSPKYKINNLLHKLIFYEMQHYEDNLRKIVEAILTVKFERIYFSFGRFDIAYEGDDSIEKAHENLLDKIKCNGRLDLVYERKDDVFAYSGYLELNNKNEVISFVIKLFSLYYSCSVNFFNNSIDYDIYHKLIMELYRNRDIDNKNLFKNLNYEFSLFKPLSNYEVYLTFNKKCQLPIFIKNQIPSPPKRATSILGRLKEKIYGYPWVIDY